MTAILRLSLPLTLWLTGFSAVYALQGLSCSRHWPEDLDARTVLVVAALVVISTQAAMLLAVHRRPSPSPFVQAVSVALALVAVIAAVWTSLPVVLTPVCL